MTVRITPDKHTRYKVASGTVTLDGTNPTSVATGLKTLVSAVATVKATDALGDATHSLSVNYGSDGQLDIYGWMPISGSDPTLVASTGVEEVDWVAVGY
jgi:hypothetical protein